METKKNNVQPLELNQGSSFGQLLIKLRTVLILIALTVIFTILKPKFIYPTNLMNMIKRMSYVAITAFGITFVMTLGGLDLSGGSIAALTGVTLAYLLREGWPIGIVLPLVLVLAALLGVLNAVVIVEGKIAPFLTTLATMNIYRGIALTLTSGRAVSIKLKSFTNFFGNGKLFGSVTSKDIADKLQVRVQFMKPKSSYILNTAGKRQINISAIESIVHNFGIVNILSHLRRSMQR